MNSFEIGGQLIAAGSRETIDLQVSVLANNTPMKLPVHVIHGASIGPVFFISAVVHGDEIQGVEIVRRVLSALKNVNLRGTLLAVPIVNSFGFLNHSRYMPDRRDLNRSFPGSDQGSLASLLADFFFRKSSNAQIMALTCTRRHYIGPICHRCALLQMTKSLLHSPMHLHRRSY